MNISKTVKRYAVVSVGIAGVLSIVGGNEPVPGHSAPRGVQPDTLAVDRNTSIIIDGGRQIISIRKDQNIFRNGRHIPRDLSIKRSSSAVFSREVRNDVCVYFTDEFSRFRVEFGTDYVEYEPIGISPGRADVTRSAARSELWDNVDVELVPKAAGIKENLIIKSSLAPHQFAYRVKTNLPVRAEAASIRFGEMFISRVSASDALNEPVAIGIDLAGDILTVTVTPGGAVYPITVDPTVEKTGTLTGGRVYVGPGGTYATERNSASGDVADNNSLRIGQEKTANFYLYRDFITFDLSAVSGDSLSVDSVVVDLYGTADNSDTDFDFAAYASWFTAFTTATFNDFFGWTASGTYTGVVPLTEKRNSSSFKTGYGNSLRFTAAGIDTLEAHFGDSLRVVLLSDEDINASEPVGLEALYFDDATTVNLNIYYTPKPDTVGVPFGVALVEQFYNQVVVTAKDTAGLVTNRAVFYDSLNAVFGDTIRLTSPADSLVTDTLDYAGLFDSLMIIRVLTVDTAGVERVSRDSLVRHALAQRLPTVTAVDTSADSIRIAFPAARDSNPDRVFYRLEDREQWLYISPSGDTSGTDSSWYAKTAFDTLTFPTRANTPHRLAVNTRNSDSTATGIFFVDSLWSWAAVPDIDSVFAHSRDSVLIVIDPKSNPPSTYFAVEDSLTELYVDYANHTLRSPDVTADSSWAWATFSEWGGPSGYYIRVEPGGFYVFRAYAKEGTQR